MITLADLETSRVEIFIMASGATFTSMVTDSVAQNPRSKTRRRGHKICRGAEGAEAVFEL